MSNAEHNIRITFGGLAYSGWHADCTDNLPECQELKKRYYFDAQSAGKAIDDHLEQIHGVY